MGMSAFEMKAPSRARPDQTATTVITDVSRFLGPPDKCVQLTWLQLEVVAPFHVLDQTEARCELVLPDAGHTGTVLEWAERLIPFPVRVDGVSHEHVSAGKTKEFLYEERS